MTTRSAKATMRGWTRWARRGNLNDSRQRPPRFSDQSSPEFHEVKTPVGSPSPTAAVCSASHGGIAVRRALRVQAARTSSGSLLTLTISHGLRYSTGASVATVMRR